MARGTASGYIDWGGKRHEFTGAPAYSEKNWGAGFPKKWWWVQAEDFEGAPDVALTAVGAPCLLQLGYPVHARACLPPARPGFGAGVDYVWMSSFMY